MLREIPVLGGDEWRVKKFSLYLVGNREPSKVFLSGGVGGWGEIS